MGNNNSTDYQSVRYAVNINEVTVCYICGTDLNDETTSDHIIPNHLFEKNDPDRPQLPVHPKCNSQKSKEDQWFVKHIQLRSIFDPRANKEFSVLMENAEREKSDAYIVGKKLYNYKLARGMFDKALWGLELKHKDTRLLQLKISHEDADRFHTYIETMCKGLFIRNVPLSKPNKPDLILKQYVDLELRGKDEVFMSAIYSLVEQSKGTKFGQRWGDKLSYIGSRVAESADKGFLFIQFYTQFGILATFN